jgi:DNA-binding protein YbaB
MEGKTTKAQKDTTKLAVKTAEASTELKELEVTLSSGAVVKVVPPKTRVLYRLYSENPAPKPPMVHMSMGGKELDEPNPNDPEYILDLAEHQTRIYEIYTKLIILTSVTVVSLPKGVLDFEHDKEWLEDLVAIGLSKEYVNRQERWLEWFFYRIAPEQEDVLSIQQASAKLQGVSEEKVDAAAEETFPNNS